MRFPWLQVDADFIAAHAGDLGAHLGISRREAMGLALDLWTWALARAPDDTPPDGLVTGTGPVPDRLLSGSVGWTGPAEQFSDALVACGLAERVDDGYRLTGFSRYRATWEKNRRRPGGKPERNRSGTGTEPDRKTQIKTQKKEVTTLSAGADDFALTPPNHVVPPIMKPRQEAAKAPRGDERHAPLVRAIVEAEVAFTGRPYAFRGGRDAKAVSECLKLADQDPASAGELAGAEVLRRWRIGRQWQGFPACSSMSDLATHWNAYAVKQRVTAKRTDSTQSDFSILPEGGEDL